MLNRLIFKAVAPLAAAMAGLLLSSAASADGNHWGRHDHHPHFFHHAPGPRHLREIAAPQRSLPARSIDIVFRDGRPHDFGSYAGAGDVYRAEGGTYALGSGGGWYQPMPPRPVRPTARIIDVRSSASPCAYEHGVCVIRP